MTQQQVPKALFVTGTDTEIGKTFVASALLRLFSKLGFSTAGMKPIAAGVTLEGLQWHNDDVDALDAASTIHPEISLRCPYLLQTPAAPHLAAQIDGVEIDMTHIVSSYQKLCALADVVVVEGVGGFRVPLNQTQDTSDLAEILNLPVVLVVGLRLGCINQALLTFEAIKARGLEVWGWVANSTQIDMAFEKENIESLRQRLPAPYFGHLPRILANEAEFAYQYLNIQK
jgi:dethiobiotin synthetase